MFKLLRYFCITSLISIVVTAIVLGTFYRHIAVGNLLQMGERNNLALTGALSNALWSEYALLASGKAGSGETEHQEAPLAHLHQAVLAHTRGLSIIKIKIYSMNGNTVYSSDPKQIGESKSTNAGFRSAAGGQAASELTHRDTFSAFEQIIEDRDVLSSYIPVRRGNGGEVAAVFEIYDDVTPLLAEVSRTQKQIVAGLGLVLASLFGILFLIVRHANSILHRQHAESQRHESQLEAARDALEQRVRDRTADLENANAALNEEIRERRQTEQHLIEAMRIADEASRAKSQFLANMSHEIRTPLNGVVGMTELMQIKGTLDSEQKQYVKTIRESTHALIHIVDDILDISKIEAGQLELNIVDYDLSELVGEVMDLHEPNAREKGLAVVRPDCAGLPKHVQGDAGRLRQVLNHVIGNAVKFTAEGRIELRVTTEPSDSKDRSGRHLLVRFEVSDTGMGVSESAQRRLFQPFVQGDESYARHHGGTGLGLAISRKLLEMMGGAIGVVSHGSQGSTFWFTVCLERAKPLALVNPAGPRAGRVDMQRESARVLIAEDDLVNQMVAAEIVRSYGYMPVVVPNGTAVLEAFEAESFDAILMDCHMPGMDGFEATAEIRRREAARASSHTEKPLRIPIIAFTANAMRGARERCLEAGMDDYIAKPLSTERLRDVLARWTRSAVVPRAAA